MTENLMTKSGTTVFETNVENQLALAIEQALKNGGITHQFKNTGTLASDQNKCRIVIFAEAPADALVEKVLLNHEVRYRKDALA